jgi:hypothetical protein
MINRNSEYPKETNTQAASGHGCQKGCQSFVCQHQIFSRWITTARSSSLEQQQLLECPPNTNRSLRNLSTALLSLLEHPHPHLLTPHWHTHRYTKTIPLIPIMISNKKHLDNELGVILYLHLIQTHVFTSQHRHRL